MQRIALAIKNALDSGSSWYGQADVATPLANLADPVFAKSWRYTPGANADGSTVRFAAACPLVATNHLVLCRHNLSAGAQIRVRAGTSRFDADFTADSPSFGDVTFGGGTNGTRTNEFGVLLTGQTAPRYEHDRRYFENGFLWSDDVSNAAWVADLGALKYQDGMSVAFSGPGAVLYQVVPQLYNDTYEVRSQVRLVSGNGDFSFVLFNGTGTVSGPTLTATSAWQPFSSPIVAGANTNTATVSVAKVTGAGVLQVRKLQIRRGASGGSYRRTTTQRRYQRLGMVAEGAATNSLLRSIDYVNAAWSKVGAPVITAAAGIAPDGTNTISSIPGTTGAVAVFQDLTLGGTTTRGLSHIFKAGGTATSLALIIQWQTGGTTQSVTTNFNPSTGAFISSSGVGITPTAAGVKDLGGGFFRAFVAGTGTSAANTVVRSTLSWTSNGTLLAWGSQTEASYVTTYIPTTTAAVTRAVDTAVVEVATWLPYVWNQGEGTVYHETMVDDTAGGPNATILGGLFLAQGAAGTDINLQTNIAAGVPSLSSYAETASVAVINSASAVTVNTVLRQAMRYRAGDWAASRNGALSSTAAGAALGPITSVNLMAVPGSTGYLRRVAIWPTGKTNAELQAITTSGPGAVDMDTGWDDALQMSLQDPAVTWGQEYDIVKTFPTRLVEWVRVEMFDPAKTAAQDYFEVGRAFMGKTVFQPAKNAEYGLNYGWRERTTFDEAMDGRKFFRDLPRIRECAFTFPKLTPAEGDLWHEIQGAVGTSQEVLYLPDADDEAQCQRTGGVGYLKDLDRIAYPMVNIRQVAVQWEKKR